MNNEWQTPDDLYQALDREFDFKFDLCANKDNAKCPSWSSDIDLFFDNMDSEPFETYWMNPPYSRGKIEKCMQIASMMGWEGNTVVCLVRFDPSTDWFQKFVDGKAQEVRMLDRRVKFKGAPSAYNFPLCVVVYNKAMMPGDYPTDYFIWGWK